jgi:acyl-coenzyme A thioesterase 13
MTAIILVDVAGRKQPVDKPAYAHKPPALLTDGPLAGWLSWGSDGADPYETLIGPFCFRVAEDETAVCAFQPRPDHLNSGGAVHGGLLMSFADFALFSFAYKALARGVNAVTLTCNCEFIGAANLDGWVEARGEVLRETKSLLFTRGVMTQQGRTVLAFSGTLKKIGA